MTTDLTTTERRSEAAANAWAALSTEERAQRCASIKAGMAAPEVRDQKSLSAKEACARPEVKANKSAAAVKMWAALSPEERSLRNKPPDPEAVARRNEKIKDARNRPESKALTSKESTAMWAALTPEEHAKRIGALVDLSNNPEILSRRNVAIKQGLGTPESKALRSEVMRNACARPEVQSRRLKGRVKAAAALIASRGGREPTYAEETLRRADLLKQDKRRHLTWGQILIMVDPIGSRAMSAEDRAKGAKRLSRAVAYWKANV
jgi:hypothetical protein